MNRHAFLRSSLWVIIGVLTAFTARAASTREILSREALNVTAWATAGLEVAVPPDIRRNVAFLREDLLDEAKGASETGATSYKVGAQLCEALIAALDNHDQMAVRAGYRAAQADANTKVTSPDLEVRRNYMMSWTQYAREQSQRSEIQRQQNNQTALANQQVRVEWANHIAVLQRNLDVMYRRYREALRQDPSFQMSHQNFTSANPAPAQPSQPAAPPPTATPPAENIQDAAITVTCSGEPLILPLEAGQARWPGGKSYVKHISPELSGWRFVTGADRAGSYTIHVHQDGFLFGFGGNKTSTISGFLNTEEGAKWEDATGTIRGNHHEFFCIRRKVSAGEVIKLNGFRAQLAAKSIRLNQSAGDKQSESGKPSAVPTSIIAPAGNIQGVDITISCSEAVRILPLEVGQRRHFDATYEWTIRPIAQELSGWQFVSVPQHSGIITYSIRVNQDGVLYAFGGGSPGRNEKVRNALGVEEISKWEDAAGAIKCFNITLCLRRKVFAGEVITLKSADLHIAAKSIELAGTGKAESGKPSVAPTAIEIPANVKDLFTAEFRALPPDERCRQVTAKLKELNPELTDADITYKKGKSEVVGVRLKGDAITNLWPVRSLVHIGRFACGSRNFEDLSPLAGMPLSWLQCTGTKVHDLTPLRGMPLKNLFIHRTPVADLSPLVGLQLVHLNCAQTRVTDFSPLQTMHQLRILECDFVPNRDTAILRSMKTLERINHLSAQDFWKRVDAGEAPQPWPDKDEDL